MNENNGLALLCDQHGVIIEVLRNPPALGVAVHPGMLFARLAAGGSLARGLSFLTDVRTRGAMFDQEINVTAGGQIKTLHFVGGMVNEQILIVGSEDNGIARQLYDEMMRMSNEQTNALRIALKEAARDDRLYDEISRLNNELMTAQRQLAKTNAELQQLNKEKNRFLGMAAHDLRNPLHTILMHSEFLYDETSDPQQQEFLQVISEASQFMAQLVDDLLDVAKIEAGELQLDYTGVDLTDFMRRNLELNRPLAARKGITIESRVNSLPVVIVDSAKLAQVLNNLLSNAIKFSQPDSRVIVTVKRAEDAFLLCVADQGPGIAPEQMSQLFRAFQRGQPGSQGEKSTGLGLVIVKRIVEGHGGKIWVESTPGQGATFFVRIPLQPAER